MLKWVWVRIKAMHWAAKLLSVVFLMHAGVLLAQAYQLRHLKVPTFDELRRAEGKLILVRQGRDWLTGIEHADGTKELFTCALPGVSKKNLCFMDVIIEKYGLDRKPEVILWWYPLAAPLEDRVYRYIFQVQLAGQSKPLGYGNRINYSFEGAPQSFKNLSTKVVKRKIGLAMAYVFGIVFIFLWESYKYSTKGQNNGS